MKHRRSIVSALLAGVVVLSACHKEPPPPPQPTGPTEEELAQQRADSIRQAQEAARRQAEEEARRRREEAERREAAISNAREALMAKVFFEYDKSDITPEAAQTLRRKVDVLRASPNVQLRLEGHADERGSTEYNLALGQRRAESVRQFLTNFGLSQDRFSTISYGEERPLMDGHNEEAWAQNRRVEFVITAGQDQINAPGNMDR